MDKTRINLANPQELLELPGLHEAAGDAIVRHRGQHGPIGDAIALTQILGPEIVTPAWLAHLDCQPADGAAAAAPCSKPPARAPSRATWPARAPRASAPV